MFISRDEVKAIVRREYTRLKEYDRCKEIFDSLKEGARFTYKGIEYEVTDVDDNYRSVEERIHTSRLFWARVKGTSDQVTNMRIMFPQDNVSCIVPSSLERLNLMQITKKV